MTTVVPREALPQWNDLVAAHALGWWWHRTEWIDYCTAYHPRSEDHSFAVMDGTEVVALVPMVIDQRRVVCGGQVPKMLLVIGDRDMATLVDQLAGHLATLPVDNPFAELEAVPWLWQPAFARLPHQLCDTFVVELWHNEDELFARIRKSYRHLIRDAEREFYMQTISAVTPSAALRAMDHAHALHTAAAGRETRSQATWDMMANWVRAGNAVLALAYHDGSVPVGYAYVIRDKAWAYYASGAVVNDASGHRARGVAHALQWRVMRALRAGESKFYELGHAADDASSSKDAGIALFKSGFGGVKMPVISIRETAR